MCLFMVGSSFDNDFKVQENKKSDWRAGKRQIGDETNYKTCWK